MMERPTCKTCPYFHAIPREEEFGFCRRQSPRPQMLLEEIDDEGRIPVWPEVLMAEWCGEHPDFPAWISASRGPTAGEADWKDVDWGSQVGPRIVRGLRQLGIRTWEQLASTPHVKLESVRQLGPTSIEAIKEQLKARGL